MSAKFLPLFLASTFLSFLSLVQDVYGMNTVQFVDKNTFQASIGQNSFNLLHLCKIFYVLISPYCIIAQVLWLSGSSHQPVPCHHTSWHRQCWKHLLVQLHVAPASNTLYDFLT